jgi:murein peptide amidase A
VLSFPARRRAGLFVCAALLAGPVFAGQPVAATPLASLDAACDALAVRVKGVPAGECKSLGLNVAGSASVRGQPLLWRDFHPGRHSRTPARRVLLIGGIHGDELSSVAVVFEWMRRLGDQETQPFSWRVVPMANPDGVLGRPPTRVNASGVDLNRNFPTPGWAEKAPQYWKLKTGSDRRRYPGPRAASEPETQWLMAQIKSFKPDAIVSIHAPYGVLDFDGPRVPPRRLGFLTLNELGTYPGSLGNYAGSYLGLPIITLELPSSDTSPTVAQSGQIWNDLLVWLEKNLPDGAAPMFQRLADPNWLRGAP